MSTLKLLFNDYPFRISIHNLLYLIVNWVIVDQIQSLSFALIHTLPLIEGQTRLDH